MIKQVLRLGPAWRLMLALLVVARDAIVIRPGIGDTVVFTSQFSRAAVPR